MLVTIDVGNSNITIGLFDRDTIKGTFRMTTKIPRTSDEYGIFLTDLLTARRIDGKEINAVIIASVVPDVMHSLTSGILKYFHVKPIIVGPGIRTGIKLATENPREMGADRIVDAVAAYELYGGPVLVIDFGTATTHDLVLEDGSLVAGVTSPGIRISANALWNNAAKLPEIEIRKPESILAKNTVTSMQAGLIYGCIGQTEYIIRRMKEEAGLKEMKVVATGGLGKIISKETDAIDVYDPDLTLKGLKRIYEKQGR
ncbi:MAG: type III pantothenate kinase [Bacteroides sp.]|nr:type III pantothenate kinase [Bacteroides sp.]MCM1550181.1 type III pantothenate kinase [Clostridium sp.]